MEWRESIAIEESRWQKWREDQSAAMMEMYAEIKSREAERESARDAREAQRDAREAQREIELDKREDERQMRFDRNERSRFWLSIIWSVGVAGGIGILSSVVGGVVERGYVFEPPKTSIELQSNQPISDAPESKMPKHIPPNLPK